MSDISTVFSRFTGRDLEFVDKATGTVVYAFRNAFGSNPVYSTATGLTALASGGQAGATPITTVIADFTTVASDHDSALLPVAVLGLEITVCNAGAKILDVYPASGQQINSAGANVVFSIAAGKVATFLCPVAANWRALLGS